MASRGEIRDAFYSRLSNASGTYNVEDAGGNVYDTITLDAENIDLISPEPSEKLPQIVYDESYTTTVFNGVGSGPDMVTYETDGVTVKAEIWREYIEAQFTIFVRAPDEASKEPIYEAVRREFAQLGMAPQWPETDLHQDVDRIEMNAVSSVDVGDAEDVIRGDQLEVVVTFHRDYALQGDNITAINSTVEGRTYNTT